LQEQTQQLPPPTNKGFDLISRRQARIPDFLGMPKSGIRIVSDSPGAGPVIRKGDRIRVRYDVQLNRGDYLARDQETTFTVGDRGMVAGFRYGLEGMRAGGTRQFRAGPHLCYRD
jgi:FKBP-type peptidyl-prolyl cis-trans isomerase